MSTLWHAPARPSDAPGRDDMDSWSIRLSADINELAASAYEEIMGHEGEGGHKPARADIQKLKDLYDLHNRARLKPGEERSSIGEGAQAAREWDEHKLSPTEMSQVESYQYLVGEKGMTPNQAFDQQTYAMAQGGGGFVGHEEEAKKFLGGAIRKFEDQQAPRLYTSILSAVSQARELSPESYKIWPWMIKQIKEQWKTYLLTQQPVQTYANKGWPGDPPPWNGINHMVDVVTEVGPVLNKLRQENRIPENFDLSKMSFWELETWFMQWKKENRGAEAQGEIVFKYPDGWTMQKLTTEDQCQYEGDTMGHCVGGYGRAVESGQTIIFSLRDTKGEPHVTIEVEALDAYRGDDVHHLAEITAEYVHPDKHEPGTHFMQGTEDPTGTKPFEIVQIMGTANNDPKPEYKKKVKEFLDSLRAKGWDFVRSEGWHNAHGADDYVNGYEISNESDLDDWWDEYRANHQEWKGNHTDDYGMPREGSTTAMRDFELMLDGIIENNRRYQDGSIRIGNFEEMAQKLYHAFWMEFGETGRSDKAKASVVEAVVGDIERAEEKVTEGIDQWYHDNYDYFRAQIEEKYEELGGKYEEDEAVGEDEEEEPQWNSYGQSHGKTAADEDLWYEAEEKVRDEIYDEQYGDSMKFFNYLHHLFDRGFVARNDLPDPHQRGGLPSYQDFINPKKHEEISLPGALSAWRTAATPIEIHPISPEHNIWFDEDGNQKPRYRPGWAKNEKGKMEQTGELEDTFLDKQGRQGQGVVAYHQGNPIGSVTWVTDPNGWHMLGTAYVHPDYREQGVFKQMVQPLRDSGKPIDAYVWNNPWLKRKVRGWQLS